MKDEQLNLVSIHGKESELESLVNISDKNDLAQCVRLLSMYLAVYKKDFGDIPSATFDKLLVEDEVGVDGAIVFENGISEAIAMLNLVLQSQATQELNNNKFVIN